jgi:hypothetical protein
LTESTLRFFRSLVLVVAAPAVAVAVSRTDIFGGGGGAGLRGVFALMGCNGAGLSGLSCLWRGDCVGGGGRISSATFITESVTFTFIAESAAFIESTLTTDMGRFS